jgi:hypothetical protein
MPDSYTFEDTDALLASLSGSSVPTLSPSDFDGQFSSGKSSAYSVSPGQNIFGDDEWSGQTAMDSMNGQFNSDDFAGMQQNDDFTAKADDLNLYMSSIENSPENITELSEQLIKSETSINPENLHIPKEGEYQKRTSSERKFSGSAASSSKVSKPKKDRSSHNIIEKKYRTNINAKITALRDAVPSLRMAAGDTDMTLNDLDGLSPASKINKASVLTKATEYIKHLEKKNAALVAENQRLRQMAGGLSPTQQQMFTQFPPQQQQPQMYSHQPQQQQNLSPFQPAVDFNGQPINVVSQQPQQFHMGMPGKVLVGGLATMVGQNLFNGNEGYDYHGLSAFPIFGTPQFQIFARVVKFFFVTFAFTYILVPQMFSTSRPEEKKGRRSFVSTSDWYELMKELVFISVGQQKKKDATDHEISQMLNSKLLDASSTATFFSLLFTLFKLQTFNSNFEVEFGKLVIGKLLKEHSDLSSFLNVNSIIQSSVKEISNMKVSDHSLRYFFKELQTPNGQSTESFKRLLNVISALPLDLNCSKGINCGGYKLILKDARVIHDYKNLLVSFRANELFREVLLKYIDLTFNNNVDSLDSEELKETKKEVWSLLTLAENFSPERSIIQIRIKLFKSILNEKYLDNALKLVNEEALESTDPQIPEGACENASEHISEVSSQHTVISEENEDEVEDDDIYTSEDERFDDQEDQVLVEVFIKDSPKVVETRFRELLSRDLFNSLTSASILKYARLQKHQEAKKLMRYIETNKEDVTLLSFISMFKLVQKYPRAWCVESEGEVLEKLVGVLRLWIGDSHNQSFNDLEDDGLQLKREISDKLVEVGKSLSNVDA